MEFVTRKKIQEAKTTVGEPFFVKAWDAAVNFKKWNGKQRATLLSKVMSIKSASDIASEENVKVSSESLPDLFEVMTEIVILSICDENGNMLYDGEIPEDIAEVECIDAETLQILFEEAAKRNGLYEKNLVEEIKN